MGCITNHSKTSECVHDNAWSYHVSNEIIPNNFTVRKNVYFTILSPDILEVRAVVTLEEEVFDEELESKTSPRYQEMERNVKQQVKN